MQRGRLRYKKERRKRRIGEGYFYVDRLEKHMVAILRSSALANESRREDG
jgi:hypothetical protein